MAKKVSRKEEEKLKKLSPAERKAIKKQKKRDAYQKEKAQRKEERYQSESKKFRKRHRKGAVVMGIVLAVVLLGGLFYWMNTGLFEEDSYKFFSYDKYVKVASTDKLTYKKSQLKVSDKDVEKQIQAKLKNAGEKKLTEAFIKKNTDNECKTKAEYEKHVREQLEKDKKNSVGSELLSKVSGNSKLKKTPKLQLKAAKKDVEQNYEQMASQYGMDVDSLIKAYGMDEKSYQAMVKNSAKESVKLHLVAHAIAKEEGIRLSSSDYDQRLKEFKESTGLSEKQFKKQAGSSYEDYAKENNFEEYFFQEKVGQFLVDKATAK